MPSILICDDSTFARRLTRGMLEETGFTVVGEARDGIEAVEQYRSLRPDLLLVDLVMPRLFGTEAIRRIRTEDPSARILVFSAMGHDHVVEEAMAAGASGFLRKPANPELLAEAIRVALC